MHMPLMPAVFDVLAVLSLNCCCYKRAIYEKHIRRFYGLA